MSVDAAGYARFVPDRLRERHAAGAAVPKQPGVEFVRGTVALADVVGFTALTDRYAKIGPGGIETLSALLNEFFQWLDTLVHSCGGDIVSFAGDSLMALWTGSDQVEDDHRQGAMAFSLLAGRGIEVGEPGTAFVFKIRVALVSGEFQLATIGGIGGHWHYAVVGDPLRDLARQLRISIPCVSEPAARAALDLLLPAADERPFSEGLRCYIPPVVLEHIDARQLPSMSEYRTASMLFAGWDGIECSSDEGLAQFQFAVESIQRSVARFDGAMTRVIVDDKGANAMAIWGISGRQHEDDAARAVEAALDIQSRFLTVATGVSVGVATGRVLCGLKGGVARCEFSVTGNAVNLASRLMALRQGTVICDAPTVHRAQPKLAFEAMSVRHSMKGRDLPCDAFRALARAPANEPAFDGARARSVLVGRADVRDRLVQVLDTLHHDSRVVVILEGEPGIGKTSLLREAAQAAKERQILCMIGCAESVEARTIYFPWRLILQQFLRLQATDGISGQRSFIYDALKVDALMVERLALLNDVLPLGFDETITTQRMGEQARAEGTAELIVRLLKVATARQALLLVLDDAQWMDSMSWQVAHQVLNRVSHVAIAISMRADHLKVEEDAAQAQLFRIAERIELQPLTRDETAALLCVRLGVSTVSPDVVSAIYEKAAGNPLFSEEVILALQRSGRLSIHEDHCSAGVTQSPPSRLNIGDTVQRVIAARIDLLSPADKTALKVASVVGSSFSARLLAALLAFEGHDVNAEEQLAAFCHLGLVTADANADPPRYSFKHGITQEVAYEMLTDRDQHRLHQSIALWHERENADDLAPMYPLLAHHWEKAGDTEACLKYLYKAGELAVNRFANLEAVDLLQRTRALLEGNPGHFANTVRASCERLLGNALLWLGRLSDSRIHLQNSVALLGFAIPATRRAQVFGSLRQLAVLFVRRVWRSGAEAELAPHEREAAMAMLRLGHIGYFQEDPFLMFFTSVRCIDFVERSEPCRETALMLAALSGGAGSVPLHRAAKSYGERALQMADMLDDSSVTSQALLFTGIYRVGLGEWELGLERIERADELSLRSGDNRRREECMVVHGYLHFFSGWCGAAFNSFNRAAEAARARGDRQTTAWGLLGMARVRIHQHRYEAALQLLAEASGFASDRLSMIELHGQLALSYLRQGDLGSSMVSARRGLDLTRASRPTSFSTLTGLTGLCQAFIELWSRALHGQLDESPGLIQRDADVAFAALRTFARIFPVGKASWLLLRGDRFKLLGSYRHAKRSYSAALAAAERLRMPYEQAEAAFALIDHSDDTRALQLQERAEAIHVWMATESLDAPPDSFCAKLVETS